MIIHTGNKDYEVELIECFYKSPNEKVACIDEIISNYEVENNE